MSLIKTHLQEVEPNWPAIFEECFGNANQTHFVRGDEAFYKLLGLGRHDLILARMVTDPGVFCRAKIVSAFFKGEYFVSVPDGKGQNKTCQKASQEIAGQAAGALAPILMDLVKEEMDLHPKGVDKGFWLHEGAPNYRVEVSGGERAQAASSNMHSLLNIAEGLGDKEAFRQFGMAFQKGFNNLPAGVYARIKPPVSTQPNLVRADATGQPERVARNEQRNGDKGNNRRNGKPEGKPGRERPRRHSDVTDDRPAIDPATAEDIARQMQQQEDLARSTAPIEEIAGPVVLPTITSESTSASVQ